MLGATAISMDREPLATLNRTDRGPSLGFYALMPQETRQSIVDTASNASIIEYKFGKTSASS